MPVHEETITAVKRFHAHADQTVEAIAHLLEMHAHKVEEDVDDVELTIEHVIKMIETYRRRNTVGWLNMPSIAQKNKQIGWMQAVCVLHKYASPVEFMELSTRVWIALDNKPEADQHLVQPDAAAAADAG
jgi:hypothetical protein